jgi:hypothetical protein
MKTFGPMAELRMLACDLFMSLLTIFLSALIMLIGAATGYGIWLLTNSSLTSGIGGSIMAASLIKPAGYILGSFIFHINNRSSGL